MSLESNLELNNQLLTKQNALLERLCIALASGVALKPDTVAQVQEYRETVTESKKGWRLTTYSSVTLSRWLRSTRYRSKLPKICCSAPLTIAMRNRRRVVQIDALDSALQA
jgi:hypothetical protein